MIGYLKGRVLHFGQDGILLLVGSVGYEILLSAQLLENLSAKKSIADEDIALYIYYHQTERIPKPSLIGFETMMDKEFFQTFITVDAIGPMKAVKAMSKPTGEIAAAIENKDIRFLCGLNGIGKRTSQKIIATLQGKVDRFAVQASQMISSSATLDEEADSDIVAQVEDVLVGQLGHSTASAKRMIREAFERKPDIKSPEMLFDEIFREPR